MFEVKDTCINSGQGNSIFLPVSLRRYECSGSASMGMGLVCCEKSNLCVWCVGGH